MFHCDGCWDNPCTCGKGYQHMSRADRYALAELIGHSTEALRAEIGRLRSALKDIAIGCGDRVLSQDDMRARAFDALRADEQSIKDG